MILPEALAVKKMARHNAYRDEKSFEAFTGKTKPKYKVCGSHFLDQCIFFVLTSDMTTCKRATTFSIGQTEWEDREQNHLSGTSYLDVTKHEAVDFKTVTIKVNDASNGLKRVAKLPSTKLSVLSKCLTTASKSFVQEKLSQESQRILANQSIEEEEAKTALRDLGLS